MPILLYRVDERLIHGQVVIGWGNRLQPERYVVVDEALAGSDWEQELYRLSLDGDADTVFVGPDDARKRLDGWRESPVRTVLLTRDLETMLSLAAEGRLAGEEVNLGGIHHAPGRRSLRSYLHLGPDDVERLRSLERLGVDVSARDLPDSPRVTLDTLLEP